MLSKLYLLKKELNTMVKNQKSYIPEFKQQIDIYFRYIGNVAEM